MTASTSPKHSPGTSKYFDELLSAMGDERRRRVLYYLRQTDGVARVDDLRRHLAEETGSDPDILDIHLHNTILPRLGDIGAVAYDPGHRTVFYQGGSKITELVDWLKDQE